MKNTECAVKVTVYRVQHGDGAIFYCARFEYLGNRDYPRRVMELMEPVPFDGLYDAIRRNPPHLALNLEGATEALNSGQDWATEVELSDDTLEDMYMYE